jgi:hypothetical protein
MPLEYTHREKLVQVLSNEALMAAGGPQTFFMDLVKAAKLSKPFLKQAIALPKGHNPDADARAIIDWADNKGGSAWVEGGEQYFRVLRGGSWIDYPRYCRSADRFRYNPVNTSLYIGFRVVCSAPRTS